MSEFERDIPMGAVSSRFKVDFQTFCSSVQMWHVSRHNGQCGLMARDPAEEERQRRGGAWDIASLESELRRVTGYGKAVVRSNRL